MTNKPNLHSLYRLMFKIQTHTLIGSLSLLGLGFFIMIKPIAPNYIIGGNVAQDLLFSLGFLCWSLIGIVIIARREADYVVIRLGGLLAKILGFLIMALSLYFASWPIWERLKIFVK